MGWITADWEEVRLGTGFPIMQAHGGQSTGCASLWFFSPHPLRTPGSALASLITLYLMHLCYTFSLASSQPGCEGHAECGFVGHCSLQLSGGPWHWILINHATGGWFDLLASKPSGWCWATRPRFQGSGAGLSPSQTRTGLSSCIEDGSSPGGIHWFPPPAPASRISKAHVAVWTPEGGISLVSGVAAALITELDRYGPVKQNNVLDPF